MGTLREAAERARGGITLPTPEQVVEQDADGVWTLGSRATLPVEEWNAQISLLTGMCAAQLMLDGRVGVVRTLPEADPRDVERLRLSAHALGVPWPAGATPGRRHPRPRRGGSRRTRRCSPTRPRCCAAPPTWRSTARCPRSSVHAAIAAPYAHTTAPLRRLVDRFVGETCLALLRRRARPGVGPRRAAGAAPGSCRRGTSTPPSTSAGAWTWSRRRCSTGRVGEVFDGAIVDVRADRDTGVVQLRDPAVRGRIEGAGLPLGEDVRVRVTQVSVPDRTVRFELAEAQADSASSMRARTSSAGSPRSRPGSGRPGAPR